MTTTDNSAAPCRAAIMPCGGRFGTCTTTRPARCGRCGRASWDACEGDICSAVRVARIWQRSAVGGWVRLTVRAGAAPLVHHWARGGDEGATYGRDEWRIDEDGDLVHGYDWHGSDCDGAHAGGGELVWRGEWHATEDGYPVPVWADADAWQRDYTAEAAGY